MKFLMQVNIPNDAGNAAARAGTLGSTIQKILDEQKPESVYFTDNNGQRCGYLVIEMGHASQIPSFCEPWFLALNASIALHPVMTPADLAKATDGIKQAASRYGT